ncbi:hypothetical protein F4Z98_06115 [Candidatus Poribacteria bacterium]|nr:hypothetical protein [Candidatus Poribacteria bacterium]MYB01745.1 hypothetical protein [Candidatus Poribacteria bacterium]
MFRDIFKNHRFMGGFAFFVLCVAGALLYMHSQKHKDNEIPITEGNSEPPSEQDTSEVGDHFVEDYEEYETSPHQAHILSISESRPAEVTIGWKHLVGNGCTSAGGGAAQRNGNTIHLTIIVGEAFGVTCTQAVVEKTGQVTVKNLEAGEYIIRGKDENAGVLGRFRIQSP